MRRHLLLLLALVACGGDDNKTTPDAPPPPPADAAPDTGTTNVALDCPTYCTEVMANCTGANAQYADMAHCLGSCATFVVGTSKVTDATGDTLGCRIYHGGAPAMQDAALHCPHAGPGGDKLTVGTPGFCSGGDLCANFCALQIKTCGSTDNPVTIGGTVITAQYKNQAACEDVCKNGDPNAATPIAKFDVTHNYATNSAGASLACRLNHWTNAATNAAVNPPTSTSIANVQAHCGHSAPQPTGPCAGTATP
jgi:hypothetical protein